MDWRPITADELEKLIAAQLTRCSPAETAKFERIRVPFRAVPIRRSGNVEQVFVVAEHEGVVVYYEDVEEGFNLSQLDAQGFIASDDCQQWELRHAINHLPL